MNNWLKTLTIVIMSKYKNQKYWLQLLKVLKLGYIGHFFNAVTVGSLG